MIIVVENINFVNFIFIILFKIRNKEINSLAVHVIDNNKCNLVYRNLLSFFDIKFTILKWDFFELKDHKKRVHGQLIKHTIAKYIFYLINKKKLKINLETIDQKNFNIFFIKNILSQKWHLSSRTINDHFLIVNALEKLIKPEQDYLNGKIIYLLVNFPFIDLLRSYNKRKEIVFINIDYPISLRLFKKYLKNIFFETIMIIKILRNNISFNNKFKFPSIENRKIIIDTDMLMRDPEKFHSIKPLNRKSFLYVSESWYISKEKSKKLNEKGFSHMPIEIYPLDKYKIKKFFSLKKYFKFTNKKPVGLNFNENLFYNQSQKDYNLYLNGWYNIFIKTGAKIFFTHNKFSSSQIAASAAIRKCSGISATMQNSFQEFPFSNSILDFDLSFCFSNQFSNIENVIGSRLKYQIAVGYTNDYKFRDVIHDAKILRESLLKNGAKKIICFFDQGSNHDKRWSLHDQKSLEGYEYLFRKLIDNDWMGLIIKPKKPGMLINKLSKINNLYLEAMQTNRCQIVEQSVNNHIKNFDQIPAYISLASDFAIHDTMVAGTAGIESALVKTPTFYLDLYNISESIFYSKFNDKIVFNNLDKLWNNILYYFNNKKQYSDLYWNKIIHKIDPYQDGNSNLRIEKYLFSLQQGFENGYSSIDVLRFSADEFMKQWGEDKIIYYKENKK
tara:strand:- start:287 stop:2302 length:2016 start_codon:yes stop_codon:yes gene_type:complete